MADLLPGTVYYVRAYAVNIAGTGYGNQISFNSGYLFGTSFAGGLVFYNDGTGHGLVSATTDQSAATWGCFGTLIGGTSQALLTGAANTAIIVAACATAGTAAKICNDLVLNSFTDLFLPSVDELNLMYLNLHVHSFGGFTAGYYWQSSEIDLNYAGVQSFVNGTWGARLKSATNLVRAVRAF
jgi:hypothetical protein